MTHREDPPATRPADRPLGGLTEATGSLTPSDADEAFVPAELREMTDPGAARDVTAAAHRRREDRRGLVEDDPGSLIPRGEGTPLNDRDGGIGSEHGLSGDDPAYAEQTHLPDAPAGRAHGNRLGGDDRSDPSEDRF